MIHSVGTRFVAALVGLCFAAGCSSSSNSDSDSSAGPGAAGSTAVNSNAPCHGTVSGAATGAFTCKSVSLIYLPSYQSDALRGNSQFTFQSATKYNLGKSPPGIESIIFSGIFPGELKPGTYTEAQLLKVENSAAALRFEDARGGGLSRLKVVVTSVKPGSVHNDVGSGRGQTQELELTGSVELVMGEGANEVVISGVIQ